MKGPMVAKPVRTGRSEQGSVPAYTELPALASAHGGSFLIGINRDVPVRRLTSTTSRTGFSNIGKDITY